MKTFMHSTAIVHEGANLAEHGIRIWHWTHVCCYAIIGHHTSIGQNVYIGPGVRIGHECKIQNNVYIPEGVTIHSNAFIGPAVTFTNVKHPHANGLNIHGQFEKTLVRSGCSIGAGSTILPGITLDRGCTIGAGSVVTKDIPELALAYGNPARVVEIGP